MKVTSNFLILIYNIKILRLDYNQFSSSNLRLNNQLPVSLNDRYLVIKILNYNILTYHILLRAYSTLGLLVNDFTLINFDNKYIY